MAQGPPRVGFSLASPCPSGWALTAVNSTHSTLQLGVTAGGAPGTIRVHVGAAPGVLGLPVLPAHVAQRLLRDPRVPPGALGTGGHQDGSKGTSQGRMEGVATEGRGLGGDREGTGGRGPQPSAYLLTGQPNPEWRAQPSGGLSEEGLGVGVKHVRQAGISALTQQQGVVPAQRLLQQPEGAVEVGELSARGRGRRCWGWAQGGVYREGGRTQAGLCSPHPIPRHEAEGEQQAETNSPLGMVTVGHCCY